MILGVIHPKRAGLGGPTWGSLRAQSAPDRPRIESRHGHTKGKQAPLDWGAHSTYRDVPTAWLADKSGVS